MFRYGGNGKSEQELRDTFNGINNTRFEPPLPLSEISTIWNDAVVYYCRNGSKKANTSYIKIRRLSPVSPIPPADQNHEKNCQKTTGDISSTGDIIFPANKIPPAQNTESKRVAIQNPKEVSID